MCNLFLLSPYIAITIKKKASYVPKCNFHRKISPATKIERPRVFESDKRINDRNTSTTYFNISVRKWFCTRVAGYDRLFVLSSHVDRWHATSTRRTKATSGRSSATSACSGAHRVHLRRKKGGGQVDASPLTRNINHDDNNNNNDVRSVFYAAVQTKKIRRLPP